jgi:YihY family inner membrane protein
MTHGAGKPADGGKRPGKISALMERVDRLQQHNRVLSVAIATWKKFSDDSAGNLAALIAYYAFASIFPLMLVAVTILDIVAKNNASLRSALKNYPVIGPQLQSSVSHGLTKTGLALVIGILLTVYGARGVATAMQNAMNTVWAVPQFRRPKMPWSLLRSLGLIAVIGPGVIATISLSSIAGGTGHLGGVLARVLATVISLVLNVGLFWLGFRLATSREVPTRDLRLSAILAAIAWQLLQLLGGYFLGHQAQTNSAYGTFGVVLGLLAWFYLQAEITLYVVELNVVRARQLWPRSLNPPPLTDADMRAYQLYADGARHRDDVEVAVSQVSRPADGDPAGSGDVADRRQRPGVQ